MVITKSKLHILILYPSLFILLLSGYWSFIVPIYGYSGFLWSPAVTKIAEGFIITLMISLLLPSCFRKPSDILVHIQFLFPVLPMLVLYGCENQPRSYLYVTLFSLLLLYIIADKLKLKTIRLGTAFSPATYQQILLALGWMIIAAIILLGGWRYFNLNIWKVYELRSVAAANLPHIFGYINPIASKVIFPFSLFLALSTKNKLYALISILGSVMMFALTAHKGPLFYPFAVIVLYYMLQKRRVISWLLTGYSGIAVCSVLLYMAMDHIVFGSLMLRRAFFVPAKLNYWYYDFFSQNQFTWWAKSKITFGLIDYPYSLDVPHLIGLNYVNSAECGANTGWLGSGFAAAGYPGMLLCAVLIGFYLAILNAYGRVIGRRVIVAIVIAPLLAVFMSTDLFTAFLTHGALFSLLLFLFLPSSLSSKLGYGFKYA